MTIKKTIAIVQPSHWEHTMGGSEYQAKLLVGVLNEKDDYDIVYMASMIPNVVKSNNHRVVEIGKRGSWHKYGLFWDFISLWSALKKEQPSLIYQRVGCAYTGICALYAKFNRIPMIWHISSSSNCEKLPLLKNIIRPHKLVEKWLLEFGIQHSNIIVVQSSEQKRALQINYHRRPEHLIRNFHPIPQLPKKVEGTIYVIWVGNFKEVKRPEMFLSLAKSFENVENVQFLMIGASYPNPEKQKAFNKKSQGVKNFQYLGRKSQKEVDSIMSKGHILVNTSTREGFANVFIQAWMRCMPVFSININPEGLLDGGYLGTSCPNMPALHDTLVELFSRHEILNDMGRKSREFAVAEFSMQNADRLRDIITTQIHTE